MDDVTAKTEAYTKQACTFGACPFEIRHQIYVLCLVTHVEIIPYPEAHEQETYLSVKAQFPSPALLAVNKVFGSEARAILYGENVWRLPPIRTITGFFPSRVLGILLPTIYHRHPNLFRSVTVVFDQREVSEKSKLAVSKRVHSELRTATPTAPWDSYPDTLAGTHQGYFLLAIRDWSAKSQLLRSLRELKLITIQLEHFACPAGCCRYSTLCEMGPFYINFLKGLTPEGLSLPFRESRNGQGNPKVVVKGLLNAVERKLVYKDFGFEGAGEDRPEQDEPAED